LELETEAVDVRQVEASLLMYNLTLDRIPITMGYVSQKMNRDLAARYMEYGAEVRSQLSRLFQLRSRPSVSDMVAGVDQAMGSLPPAAATVLHSVTGRTKVDRAARRLVVEHVFDILLSYRKYEGHSPYSEEDLALRKYMKSVIANHSGARPISRRDT
jgi:hypothetical protein